MRCGVLIVYDGLSLLVPYYDKDEDRDKGTVHHLYQAGFDTEPAVRCVDVDHLPVRTMPRGLRSLPDTKICDLTRCCKIRFDSPKVCNERNFGFELHRTLKMGLWTVV